MPDIKVYNQDILAYLPKTINQWYDQAEPGSRHTCSRLSGGLACLDASGFTALTQRLHQHGRQGPELLTNLLNRFFETLCSVAFSFEGDVLKFAGDALWIYFPEEFDPTEFLTLALNSWEEVAKEDPIASEHPISIHGGAEVGEFWLASLGDASTIMEVEPVGDLVAEVFRLCDLASENTLAIGSDLAGRAGLVQPGGSTMDSWIVKRNSSGRVISTDKKKPEPVAKDTSWAEPYISHEISERVRLRADNSVPQSEHRHVCVMFVYLEVPDNGNQKMTPDEIEQLNRVACRVIENVMDTGGSVGQIDPYMSGHKILAMFGAPRKRDNDELRAIACAMSVARLDSDRCRLRIGLAQGALYCGDVGAFSRREYTVIGDGTNRSARLTAQAAWGEVLLDEKLHNKLPAEVRTEKVVHDLKGLGQEIISHRLLGIAEPYQESHDTEEIIGRKSEQKILTTAWLETQQGGSRIISLFGEAGSGKTSLTNQLFAVSRSGSALMQLSGKGSILHEHGWLARKVLIELHSGGLASRTESFVTRLKELIEDRWWPLVADLLQASVAENEWTRGLSPELRAEKSCELYAKLIGELVDRPTLILLDDFDQADARSLMLIGGLLKGEPVTSLMIVIVSRDKDILKGDSSGRLTEVAVSLPTEADWWAFYNSQFEDGKREQEFFAKLLKISVGNPHCIIDYVDRCRQDKSLRLNPVTNKFELVTTGFKVVVPEDLKGYHLSEFDRLSESEREILKVASAMGMSFTIGHLSQVMDHLPPKTINSCLVNSVRAGLLEWDVDSQSYSFGHVSMRDAVYGCVPQQILKQIHRQIGNILELVHSDQRPDILADHFFEAGEMVKAFTYSLRAATLAHERSSLVELARALSRSDSIIDQVGLSQLDWKIVTEFYALNVEFLVLEGEYLPVFANLREWRRGAKANGDVEASFRICTRMAKTLFVQANYGRAKRVLKIVLANIALPPAFRAASLAIMAEVDRRTGSPDAAIEFARQAVELAEEALDSEALSESTNNLGLALWGKGQLAEAAKAYEQGLKLKSNIESRYSRARIVNNLAIIYWELGDFVKARTLMKESLEVFQNIGDRRNQAYCSGNLAALSRIAGRIKEAKRHFELADLIFGRLGDKHAHYYTVGNLGDIDMILGDLASAEQRYNDTMAFAKSVGDQELVAECLARAGELAFFTGDWVAAEKSLRRGMELATEIGSSEYLIRAAIGLARLSIGQKDHRRSQSLIYLIKKEADKSNAIAAGHEADFLSAELFRIRNEKAAAVSLLEQILSYAVEQQFFELNLFSLVRLYELKDDKRADLKSRLKAMSDQFEANNGPDSWADLLKSPFFRYFAETLQTISDENSIG